MMRTTSKEVHNSLVFTGVNHLALVVQKMDRAIHWIAQLVSQILIRWIVTCPVDSAIQRLNNPGLIIKHDQIPFVHIKIGILLQSPRNSLDEFNVWHGD